MDISLECGCGASLSMTDVDEPEEKERAWFLWDRFANAHVECGFVTSGISPEGMKELGLPEVTVKRQRHPALQMMDHIIEGDDDD